MLIYFEFLVVYVTLALSVLTEKSWILEPYLVRFWDLNPTRKVTLCIISIHESLKCLKMSFLWEILSLLHSQHYWPYHPSITTHNPQAFSSPIDSPSPTSLPPQPESISVDQPYTEPTSFEHSLHKTDRVWTRPIKYNDYQTNFTPTISTNNSGTKHPISYVISYNKLSSHYHNFILNVSANSKPKSYT